MIIDEAEDVYEHAKETIYPESPGQMFALYFLHVEELAQGRSEAPPKDKAPETPPITPPITPPSNGVNESRESLSALGEKISVGNVVFAAATAWPEKYTADKALLRLADYPDVPEGTDLKMERTILLGTGLKMFDWLGGVDIESD